VSEPLSDALTGVLVALCSALTVAIGIVATYAPQMLRSWLDSKAAQLRAAQAVRETSVADTSVAAAEEIGRMQLLSGAQKMELAVKIAAEKAPDAPPSATALQASVAKMRASVPSMSMMPASLAPGSMLSIPVQVVSSEPPASPAAAAQAPLPKPARVPWTEAEDAQTTRPRRP
jgi:hypothetical protein